MSIKYDDHAVDEHLLELHQKKDYKGCIEASRVLLQKNPLHLQALMYIAELNLDHREDLDECIRCCDTILQGISDVLYVVWNWKGLALALQGNHKEAEGCFLEALKYTPHDAALWSYFALMKYMQHGKDTALYVLDTAETEFSLEGKFTLARGYIERTDGNTDEALMQFLQGGMSVDPGSESYEEDRGLYAREVRKTLDKQK